MNDFAAFRTAAIQYWERRRLFYNLALLPPAVVAYLIGAGLFRAGDDYGWHPYYVTCQFALSAIGANLCYSFAYALEFLFGSDAPTSDWLKSGRRRAFVAGLLFSMALAFVGGRNIALMEVSYR